MNKQIRRFLKAIPIVGDVLYWLHTKPKLKPSYHYLYTVKPFIASTCISLLRKLITFEKIIITERDTVLDNGHASFYWEPNNAYSLLGYPLRGDFETIETKIAILFAQNSGCVVDVGGNFGWYACQLLNTMPKNGEIHIFEPVPYEREMLQKNLSLNTNTDSKAIVNSMCLSDSCGEVVLYVPTKMGAAFASLAVQNYKGGFEKIITKSDLLDNYCRINNIENIDFIKIDVEGAELKVLNGAFGILSAAKKPAMLIESSESMTAAFGYHVKDVISFLERLNYFGYRVENGTLTPLSNLASGNGYDYLFIDPSNSIHNEIVAKLLNGNK